METLFNNQWSTKKEYQAAGETSWQGKATEIDPETLTPANNNFPGNEPSVVVNQGMTERTKWIIGGSIAGVLLITTAVFVYKRLSK